MAVFLLEKSITLGTRNYLYIPMVTNYIFFKNEKPIINYNRGLLECTSASVFCPVVEL